MARTAIGSQLPPVFVGVAAHAILGQRHVGTIGVFDLKRAELRWRSELRIVALRTLKLGMLSLQWVARLLVIKVVAAIGPSYNLKVTASVLGVTALATLIRIRPRCDTSVISPAFIESLLNLSVAPETPELWPTTTQSMAGAALGHAVQ